METFGKESTIREATEGTNSGSNESGRKRKMYATGSNDSGMGNIRKGILGSRCLIILEHATPILAGRG